MAENNGFIPKSIISSVTIGLSIAGVTGILGWSFGNVITNNSRTERLQTLQEEIIKHSDWQDKQLNDAIRDRNERLHQLDERIHQLEILSYQRGNK